MLSKQTIKRNLKKWGYTDYDEEIDDFLNNAAKKFQEGGRVLMPSEYFGINSGRYSSESTASSLAVTNAFIRTPLNANDPTGAIKGGARRFEIPACSIKNKVLKQQFENKMTEFMNSVARKQKGDRLSSETVQNALNMRKYSDLK